LSYKAFGKAAFLRLVWRILVSGAAVPSSELSLGIFFTYCIYYTMRGEECQEKERIRFFARRYLQNEKRLYPLT
jgi:hypothetical protein